MQLNVKVFHLCFSFIFLAIALLIIVQETMAGTPGTELGKRTAAFAVDLYQQVIKGREQDNLIISPLSIYTALGLVYMGAAGKTKEELAAVLRITENKSESAELFRNVLLKFEKSPMLSMANKVYVKTGYELQSSFKEISEKSFQSEAANIDFTQKIMSANTMNGWVESKTNNKIKELISPDDLGADTRMVLINAIHFKGIWQNQFKKELTVKSDFWINENESTQVDMMSNNKGKYAFGVFDDLEARAVELPFQGGDLAMLIILPNSRTGLRALESKLKSVDLSSLRERMHTEEVIVSMPKFKIEFSIDLNDVLSEMGMGTIFSNDADFSELLKGSEPLKVSKVVHKAFIDVNEEGAEAAAATVHVLRKRCIQYREEFNVDHPFIFAIVCTKNEGHTEVFMGSWKHASSHRVNIAHDEF